MDPYTRWTTASSTASIVTDLGEADLDAAALAGPYEARWAEETAFLHLKHAVGLGDPRTRDHGRAIQELLGKLVLYDACSLGASGAQGSRAHAAREGAPRRVRRRGVRGEALAQREGGPLARAAQEAQVPAEVNVPALTGGDATTAPKRDTQQPATGPTVRR